MLAMASSPARTSLTYSIKPATKRQESSFRRDAETSTRDACAPQNRHASSRELAGVLVPQPIISYGSLRGAAAVWDVASELRWALR